MGLGGWGDGREGCGADPGAREGWVREEGYGTDPRPPGWLAGWEGTARRGLGGWEERRRGGPVARAGPGRGREGVRDGPVARAAGGGRGGRGCETSNTSSHLASRR
ncbi:protein of unknown function [Streptantibioticus cattleyicolor NRRL 8057 = DSM 46488]|nr:protein of unknown function [Streptantibioticus cattleyicolor NRRL 8057 = DSM 46488]